MSSEFGSDQKPVLSESQSGEHFETLRADLSQNINGRRIEVIYYNTTAAVTIDGKPFSGSFMDAVKHAASLPIRWDGMFE